MGNINLSLIFQFPIDVYPPWNSLFAPENGWLEYDRSFWGPAYFQGHFRGYVSFREGNV